MPDPATLEWEEGDDEKLGMVEPADPVDRDAGVRERTVYGATNGRSWTDAEEPSAS